ncbi:ABC transporter permease [Chloroflexota bacterium]
MKFWEIGRRNLKELYRDPIALGFLLGMPIAFILIFSLALGNQTAEPATLGIVDEDQSQISQAFIDILDDIPVLEIESTYEDPAQAKEALNNGELPAYLIIPGGFSRVMTVNQPTNLILVYDEADPILPQRLIPVIREVSLGFLNITTPVNIELVQQESQIANPYINWFIPGMAVYGLMILIPTVAGIMVRDRMRGFLQRLLTMPARPSDFIFGYTIPFIPVIIISTAVYLGVGALMGLSIIGNFGLAYLILFITGICCMGIGMIVGTMARSEEQATGIPWIFIVPLAMISGAWFEVEQMPAAVTRVAEVFPFLHAMNASRYVINGGMSLGSISYDLYWLIGWTVALFAIGIAVFRKSMSR